MLTRAGLLVARRTVPVAALTRPVVEHVVSCCGPVRCWSATAFASACHEPRLVGSARRPGLASRDAHRGPRTAGGPTDAGDPVAVPGAKERLLLAVLAADAPDVVSTDRIVETLWNGDRPASARRSLQVHLVHLRSALEPERPRGSTGRYILRRGTGYSLAADRDDVDALRFTDLAARGRALLAAGDAAEAVRTLSAALDLWRGEPYGDWPDAAFADTERRRLAEVRTGAATALLEARLALGEDAEVVAGAGAAARRRPAAGGVVAAARAGAVPLAAGRAMRWPPHSAPARAAPRSWAPIPGPRLRAIEAAVLAQDPALDLPGTARPSPARSTGRRDLPVQGVGHLPGDRRRAVPRPRAGWSPAWWRGWSTPRCWSCRGRAVPASPPSSGPGSSRRWRGRAAGQRRLARRRPDARTAPGRRAGGADR